MRTLLMVIGGFAWFIFLFVVTLVLTFPSDAVVERARWEVMERSGGAYALELSDLGLWWVGVSAQDVKLFHVVREQSELSFMARDARVSVSPFSLLARAPAFSGSVTPIDGTLTFAVGTVRSDKRDDLKVGSVQLDGQQFPVSELLLLGGVDATGSGGLDIHVDLSGEEGIRAADGEVRIAGTGIVIDDVQIPGMGSLGRPIPIDDLTIELKVADGRAEFQKGELASPLLRATFSGAMTLRDSLDRSSLSVDIVVSELGEELSAFSMMLREADIGAGKYQFNCSGSLASPRCSMGAAKPASSSRTSRAVRPSTRPLPTDGEPVDAGSPEQVVDRPDADELRKRREERLERLRALREERLNERSEGDVPMFDEDDEPEVVNPDEEIEEEELPEEPFEDEIVDEEEIFE